jgi:hypothetical protein
MGLIWADPTNGRPGDITQFAPVDRRACTVLLMPTSRSRMVGGLG